MSITRKSFCNKNGRASYYVQQLTNKMNHDYSALKNTHLTLLIKFTQRYNTHLHNAHILYLLHSYHPPIYHRSCTLSSNHYRHYYYSPLVYQLLFSVSTTDSLDMHHQTTADSLMITSIQSL